MRRLLLLLVLLAPLSTQAESSLPFLKDRVGDRELPRPWGIGFDFYTMDQDYSINSLTFTLPGVNLSDPSLIGVRNEVQHFDIKVDAWILPFLNVFGILGHLEADTFVDFSRAPITGLPFQLGELPVSYDGTVYGAGITLAYGGDNWFTSLTAVRTDTSLGGDFNSSVESTTIQPRIGIIKGQWQAWVGGLHLDTEESHSGAIQLPGLGLVPFAVDLEQDEAFNYAIGVSHHFSEHANLTLEIGFGDRDHTLFNYTYRF